MPFVGIGEIKIFYALTGVGEHLLLFPDNRLSSLAYQNDIDYFSSCFTVLAFDYPFTGQSSHAVKYPDEREVDYWGFWADLACHMLIELEIERCFALDVQLVPLSQSQPSQSRAALHVDRSWIFPNSREFVFR